MALVPGTDGMGATVAAIAATKDDHLIVFNVGDSPVFGVFDGALVQLSVSDTPPRPPGVPADARTATITQAVGTDASTPPVAHIREFDPTAPMRLLLCSDGLTDYATLDSVEALLADPLTTAQSLCRLALDGGGGDNVSVVLADISPNSGDV